MCFAGSVRGVDFTASLDRDTISLGETATLSLAFEGAQPKSVPTPNVPGLQFINAGTSQNVSIINGAMSSTVTVAYQVRPERTGEFTVPAMTVDIGGQSFTSQPLKLTVTGVNAPSSAAAVNSGDEIAFMKLILPRTKVYVGQTFTAQLQIFLRDDVQNFGNFELVSSPADGLTLGKTANGSRSSTQIGSRTYTIVPISIALIANRTGTLSLGPFAANIVVVLPSRGGGDPFFQQFFNTGEQKRLSLGTEQVSVQSLPLPEENRPAIFNGAIGNYSMSVSAGPTNVTAGDPITVRVQISGRGSIDDIKLPEQAWRDFKTFSPTVKTDSADPLGLSGRKTFEEIVTPQNTGVHELPEFSFAFFNPDDGSYHTLTQPALPLVVRSAGAAPVPSLAGNQNPSPESISRDILPVKGALGTVTHTGAPLVVRPVFWTAQTVPVAAFLAAFIWRRRTDRLANNPRLRRQRAVAQLVHDGLNDLRRFAAENNPDPFFATLFRLLQEQLGERLDCPASSITESAVDETLARRGAPEGLVNELRELFQLCNQARYAPVRGSSELTSIAARFEKVSGELALVKV
jgi:BatD DUF11 like domain